jgi:hypothetical protein
MKRLSLLLSLLAAVASLAFVTVRSKKDTGLALTGTSCVSLGSTRGTAGADLTNAAGFRVIASAPTGQTFTGGTAVCCLWDPTLVRWMDCDSKMTLTLVSGKRDVPSLDFRTSAAAGAVQYLGSSITVSSGTTFDMTYVVTEAR